MGREEQIHSSLAYLIITLACKQPCGEKLLFQKDAYFKSPFRKATKNCLQYSLESQQHEGRYCFHAFYSIDYYFHSAWNKQNRMDQIVTALVSLNLSSFFPDIENTKLQLILTGTGFLKVVFVATRGCNRPNNPVCFWSFPFISLQTPPCLL